MTSRRPFSNFDAATSCWAKPLQVVLVLFVLIGDFSNDTSLLADERPPNVVIILADDLGYGDISAYDGWIKTPTLDRIAKEGVRFTDFHSNGAVCSPTRAALVTGRYQQRVGIPSVVVAKESAPTHKDGIKFQHTTFAELMRDAGYSTAIFGKWHLGYYAKHNPSLHGFAHFRGYISGNVDYFSHIDQVGRTDWWNGPQKRDEPGYVTHLITKHSVEFIKQHRERPFCLYVAHEAPHYPYQGPSDIADRTPGGQFQSHGSRSDKRNAYREMVTEMDTGIGQILSTLEETGLKDNTFVFFFSDNGATKLGSNGELKGTKGTIWEGGHRVPAIAWWPAKIKPQVCDETLIGMDLVPTMLSIGGKKPSRSYGLDGIDFSARILRDQALPGRNVYWDVGRGRAVRSKQWKFVATKNKGGAEWRESLYDLNKDIAETRDVLKQHPEVATRLKRDLETWTKEVQAL